MPWSARIRTRGRACPRRRPTSTPSGQVDRVPRRTDGSTVNAWRSYFADPKDGPLPAMLVVLTVVTGVIDAVSILSLGRVFVANMTGNVVFIGFALVGSPGFSITAALFALAGFLIG